MSSKSYDKKRVPVSQRHMSQEASIVSDGKHVPVTLNGRSIFVTPGTTILEAAQNIGIRIPTLCTHEDLCVVGNCRVCVVEVEGYDSLQAACAYPITECITVRTHSAKIRKVRQHMLKLLLAHHTGDCFVCRRNATCELSQLAVEFGVDTVTFKKNEESRTQDASARTLVRDMNKCVLCRRCVRACIDMQEVGVMEAVGKGDHIEIETFGNKSMVDVVCIGCGQCVSRCPTAALTYSDDTRKVWQAIDDPRKHVVIQLPPSVRSSIAETIGLPPGTLFCGELISQIRGMGFDKVFDTQLANSLAVQEQAKQLMELLFSTRSERGATERIVFSSNSSGWVKYMEHFTPTFLQYLSPLKSPEQLLGTLVRTHYTHRTNIEPSSIVSVAAVPCASKKNETESSLAVTAGMKNVDYALTTLELGKMIKESGVHLSHLPQQPFDSFFDDGSDITEFPPFHSMLHMLSGVLYQMITGEPLTSEVDVAYTAPFDIPGAFIMSIPIHHVADSASTWLADDADPKQMEGEALVFGKCEGTANAKKVIEDICKGGPFSKCHYIEFLACPDGCVGGGGQPVPTGKIIRQSRKEAFPPQTAFTPAQRNYLEELHQRCSTTQLPGGFTKDDFFTRYTPRGKFIK